MDVVEEELPQRRFTRVEYNDLVRQGWFEGEPIELLRGMLVTMSPQGEDHNDIIDRILHVFAQALPIDRFGVRSNGAFAATDDSEPEPDFFVYAKPKAAGGHPTSALVLVEVSRSSLKRDRTIKKEIYAENGVPEYWIVVLANRTVEVYTEPRDGEYTRVATLTIRDTLRPLFDPTIEIPLGSLPWQPAS